MGRAREAGRRSRLIALGAIAACGIAADAEAQSAASRAPLPALDTVTVTPGGRYQAGGFKRFWLGDGWRDVWTSELRVPVLDIHRFAGGLEFEERGGGNQSITLHMVGADGVGYVFRSVDKHPAKALPHDLKNTPVGDIVQDLISSLHPAGALVTARLLDATPLLHVHPRLVVMPDDPALGEFRAEFAGMLGALEEKPSEGEDDAPGFAGSRNVADWEDMMDLLEESPEHRLATDEFVMARLFDAIINDPDRAEDQWKAARFDDPDGSGYLWRPLPRDRDWAFVNGEGALVSMVGRRIYPKLVPFDHDLHRVRPLTIQAWRIDRPLLAGVEWSVWEHAAQQLQAMLTDAAIDEAVRAMPSEWQAEHAERLAETLRARRDHVDEFAREYYLFLADAPEIQGTDESDRAEIVRQENGDVLVTIADGDGATWFRRRFVAGESSDIRLHLHGGDDVAVVSGPELRHSPFVRVQGGGGDDTLTDRTDGSAGEARLGFYDDRGDNDIDARGYTIVDTKAWEVPVVEGFISTLAGQGYRDSGSSMSWAPYWSFGGGSGLVIGAGPRITRYGYRRDPYWWTAGLTAMYSVRHSSFGGQLDFDYRLPNSPLHFDMLGRYTTFEGFRFFGYGNDSPLNTDDDETLVRMDQGRARVMAALDLGDVEIGVGPSFVWTEMDPPAELDAPGADRGFAMLGARLEGSVDRNPGAEERSGWALDLAAEAYPTAGDLEDDFQTAQAVLRGYLDLPVFGRHPKLALRVGGRQAWGAFPVFEGAFLGGMETVRGYRFDRFVGDRSAWGNVELRLPVFEMTLITRGRVGALGLGDAGRVWLDGESEGDWHTAYGGGVFYETLGRTVSVLYARGEEDRWYLQMGMPF